MDGADQKLDLPPGFRFHPTDEELVLHYLCRKCATQSLQIDVHIIADIDLYKFNPWELPEMAIYGEKEWYFFSPRDRKYPNGSRPNRSAGTGYWKATGADKPIGKPKTLGIKKSLVFYVGKAPKGNKTNWIMHEYRMANVDRSVGNKGNLKLDDWVLCRIYNKKGTLEKHNNCVDLKAMNSQDKTNNILFKHEPKETVNEFKFESVARLHTDSSSSEHVLSPEFGHEKEVQSVPNWSDLERENYMDDFQDDYFGNQIQYNHQYFSPLQDIFINMHKSF